MRWDDLRYVLALARAGSLARAAKTLQVDHTTVGRRVEAAEADLGLRLFTRTTTGYVLTAEGERVVADLRNVEDAVHALERGADAQRSAIEGTVRVTSAETFGCTYLAPRLALFARQHPGLEIDLATTGAVLDLARREADIAVRFFRSTHESLVVRRVAEVRHGLYASPDYLANAPPVRAGADLARHALLTSPAGPRVVDASWLAKLSGGARPALVCELSSALLEAARAGAGIAVLPRYLGDRDAGLVHLAMRDEPSEPVWMTVHRDVRNTPRVRAVLEHVARILERDRALLAPVGRRKPRG
jgi:DNA-binding transcriptional LysR family regulator